MVKFRLLSLAFILVAAGYFLTFQIISNFSQENEPSVLAIQSIFGELSEGDLPQTNDVSIQKSRYDELVDDIKELISSSSAVTNATSSAEVGVAVADLNLDTTFGVNHLDRFGLASVEKLLVAVYAFDQIDAGKIQYDQLVAGKPVIEHLRLLINHSDNDSWDVLNSFLGFSSLQNFALELGLESLSVSENKATSADVNRLLGIIYGDQLLSASSRERLLSFMNKTFYEQRIPQGLPKETVVYHKTGTFGSIVNDAAIVIHPQNPFMLTILTNVSSSQAASVDLIRQITRRVWDFYDSQGFNK